MAAAARGAAGVKCLTAYSTSSAQAEHGLIFQNDILPIRLAIAVFSNGCVPVSCAAFWRPWPRSYASVADSILTKLSSMEASPRPKRGQGYRENQTRQGNKNHGG